MDLWIDRQNKKALQAIEDLFTKNACVKDLCFLATKFVDENFELLNLPGRLPTEPVQQEESQSREVDSRPISQIDNADDAQRLDSRNQSEPPQTNDEEAMETDENQQHGRQDILMSQEPSRFVFDLELREADDLIRLIIRAFEDDKTVVVKHALSACIAVLLQRSATIKDTQLFEKTVEEVTNKTWDTAVQVRKQAAVCLKDLLSDEKYVEQPIVEKAWLEGLLHQVVDNEATVSQQAVKFVIEYVFKGLNDVNSDRAWALMKRVEESSEYTRYLAICLTEHTSSASNATAVKSSGNLQDMINKLLKKLEQMALKDNCPAAAWMLLCELSYGAKKIKPECAEDTWPKLNLNSSDDRIPTYVAKVLANCCSQLNDERRNTLKEKIKWQLSHTRIATTHISAVCYALARLSDGVLPNGGNGNRSGLKEMAAFAKKYNDKLLQLLDKVVLRPTYSRIASRNAFTPALASQQTQQTQQSTPTVDPMKIIRAIYTVGELAQYAPTIDNNVFNFLRAGVVTDLIEDDVARAQTRLQSQQNRMSENGSQHTAMDDDNPVLPPGAIILPDSQSSSSQNTVAPASQHPTSINGEYLLSRGVRSAIFLTLGKFSIADENIAEAITARLAKQMREDRDHCIRNNLLVVMADIFRINTTAVSDHGPAMASCLRDPSVLIRKQALFLITSLLRDEYFKWDGQTMYFYLGALLDLEVEVREQVRASLMNVLLPKNPKMLINRFVEIMFYFNDVTHPNMTVSMQHEKENCPLPLDDRFALYGERRARDRMEIYKFMISTFSDVENLPLMCRIALEVFENITEERLRLYDEDEHTNERVYNRNVVCLLKDALNIVKSKDIVLTLQAGKKAGAAEELEEETEEANHMQAVAGDMIAHTFLKTINQEVLNRMFRLKDYLKKIPDLIELAKYTHSNILDIFEHYFEHFEKLIGNDSQRRGEVKSDLERIRKRAFPRQQPSA
ncbi:hypothetical protein M3Y94_01122300 [Aphelenchoides besseyi]|nr:hypothetical protein M3Y94_01122300 [Aphelenchoides besseyi]